MNCDFLGGKPHLFHLLLLATQAYVNHFFTSLIYSELLEHVKANCKLTSLHMFTVTKTIHLVCPNFSQNLYIELNNPFLKKYN